MSFSRMGLGKKVFAVVLAVAFVVGLLPATRFKNVDAAGDYTIIVNAQCLYDYAFDTLDYVNTERKKNGLNELTMDASLLDAAMQRAAETYVTGEAYSSSEITDDIAHSRPDGTDCWTVNGKIYGENIAFGPSTPYKVMYNQSENIDPNSSADMDHSSFMRSSGHRDNVLFTKWNSVGIGCVYSGGRFHYYWSQEFSPSYASQAVTRDQYTNVSKTFTVDVTADVYNRLVSKGLISGGGSSSGSSGFASEWVGGKWYNADGSQTYGPSGSWKKNSVGWWFGDTSGWYATGWQKIEGKWYYFNSAGYMAAGEWYNGYWLNDDGSWTYANTGSWRYGAGGWWFGDTSGWYAVGWQKINGWWYYFDGSGYMVTNQYVDGYWLGADGACQ